MPATTILRFPGLVPIQRAMVFRYPYECNSLRLVAGALLICNPSALGHNAAGSGNPNERAFRLPVVLWPYSPVTILLSCCFYSTQCSICRNKGSRRVLFLSLLSSHRLTLVQRYNAIALISERIFMLPAIGINRKNTIKHCHDTLLKRITSCEHIVR